MPRGISKTPEETKKKISEALKGHKHSEETKRKIGLANSIALKGYKHSEETKKKMSLLMMGNTRGFKKGMVAWNKGKKLSERTKRKIKKGLKAAWKKGKFTEERNKKIGEKFKGDNNPSKRAEVREKLKKSGLESYRKNPKLYQQRRESAINNPNRVFRDTKIELKIEKELQKRNINYQKQVPLCRIAIVDFYLPEYRIVIQCDGDYWHNKLEQKERDERQDKVLIFNGFNVYRFWEHEINKSAEECINKIVKNF